MDILQKMEQEEIELLLHLEDEQRSQIGVFEQMEERYIRYALSIVRMLELDTLIGQMKIVGLTCEVPLTRDETYELARFCVENRTLIDELCGKAGELPLELL